MQDFTITKVGHIVLTKPLPFIFIEAEGEPFIFQKGEGKVQNITFKENYWICAYATTQEFWAAVVHTELNKDPSHFKGRHNPVETVSWDDIRVFNRFLNELFSNSKLSFENDHKPEGKFDLPSETQWEYTANANKNYLFAGSENPNDVAWFNGNANEQTHPVGLKQPNAFGLFDMSGNVWEWCADNYTSEILKIPSDGSPNLNKDKYKPLRGGSYYNNSDNCRIRYRYFYRPGNRSDSLGFRLVFSSSSNADLP